MSRHTYRDLMLHVTQPDGRVESFRLEPVTEIPPPSVAPDDGTIMYTCHAHGGILIPCVFCGGQLEPMDGDTCAGCRAEREVLAWQAETFGETIDATLAHLAKEVGEARANPTDREEFADCTLLLLGAAGLAGMSMDDLFDECRAKFEISKLRDWGPPNAEGYSEHVSDPRDEAPASCPDCGGPVEVWEQPVAPPASTETMAACTGCGWTP